MPRIFSNILLSSLDLYHLCGNAPLDNIRPRVYNKHAEVLKVSSVFQNYLTFCGTQRWVAPPVGFVATHAWDCSNIGEQVAVESLNAYELHMHRKLFRAAVTLPAAVKADDLVYIDTSRIAKKK